MKDKLKVFKVNGEYGVYKSGRHGKRRGKILGEGFADKSLAQAELEVFITEAISTDDENAEMSEMHIDDPDLMWPATWGAQSFDELIAAEEVAEASKLITLRSRQMTFMFQDITWDREKSGAEKIAAYEKAFDGFITIAREHFSEAEDEMNEVSMSESTGRLDPPFKITEVNKEDAAEFAEILASGSDFPLSEDEKKILEDTFDKVKNGDIEANRAPLFLNLAVIEPGWGNSEDNHYYPREMLTKHSNAFAGAKMYESDHVAEDKNTSNWVSTSIGSVGLTESGAPVHRIFVHHPDFAERLRNLDTAGMLNKMECSILATGKVSRKEFELEGRTGKQILSIEEGAKIDWVTQAGAGGRIIGLAETIGGNGMKEKEEEKLEESETEEVTISENEDEVKPEAPEVAPVEDEDEVAPEVEDEAPADLPAEEVARSLSETKLPQRSQDRLKLASYATAEALTEVIADEIAYVKELSGSGKVFGQGAVKGEDEFTPVLTKEDADAERAKLYESVQLR